MSKQETNKAKSPGHQPFNLPADKINRTGKYKKTKEAARLAAIKAQQGQ
jgi:hypothetical protein